MSDWIHCNLHGDKADELWAASRILQWARYMQFSCELCPKPGECTSDGEATNPNDRPAEYLRTPTSLGFEAQAMFGEDQ